MNSFSLGFLAGFTISTVTALAIATSALTNATVKRAHSPAGTMPVAPPSYVLPATPADGSGTGL